jgi:signal transduction histidine kinase
MELSEQPDAATPQRYEVEIDGKQLQPPLDCSYKKLNSVGSIGQLLNRFSISQKIGCGYAMALSVAIVGTTTGIIIGESYARDSEFAANHWHEIGAFLGNLQVAILQARSHQQQFPALLRSPKSLQEEYTHFLKHADRVKALIAQVNTSEDATNLPQFQELLRTHNSTVDAYFKQVSALFKQIAPIAESSLRSTQLVPTQQLLLEFSTSDKALKLDELSDQLTHIAQIAFQQEHQAEEALKRAQVLEVQIVGFSFVISVLLATLLAIYTSRAIARPLRSVTHVAQAVAQESNFDLQAPVTTSDEVGVLATSLNHLIQQVKTVLEEQKAEGTRQLIQSEKMSSLGRMLAGVAHEINNPVNFISGNMEHLNGYFDDLLTLIDAYAANLSEREIQAHLEAIDLEFLKQDLPKTLQSMKIGADRVRQIVLSLKNFSRLDESAVHRVNVHDCIDSTLLILNNRIKQGITMIRNYGDIPEIEGFSGSLYQVFMNILSNAIDALGDKRAESESSANTPDVPPQIIITTEKLNQNQVRVRIEDNASGIAPEHLPKIFDSFFTTKPLGVGTGLGLSISYQIVVEKHRGMLTCDSEIGKGTTFAIVLPIQR